jgi:hypothetical protein
VKAGADGDFIPYFSVKKDQMSDELPHATMKPKAESEINASASRKIFFYIGLARYIRMDCHFPSFLLPFSAPYKSIMPFPEAIGNRSGNYLSGQ